MQVLVANARIRKTQHLPKQNTCSFYADDIKVSNVQIPW